MMRLILLLCFLAYTSQTLASISGHISAPDQKRLKLSLEKTIASANDDLATIYYSVKGHSLLKSEIPAAVKKNNCKLFSEVVKTDLTPENAFYAISSWLLHGCSEKIVSKELIDKVKATLNDKATAADVYYGLESLHSMGQAVPDAQKLAQILQARLKTDDSLVNFGYTFHAASRLGASGQFAYDRIEDIVVQADEIDGKMLQFEGGLGVTSLLLSGIVRLTESLKKPLPLTQVQVEKFGNYLLSRRSVQSAKGITCLLEATKALTDTKLSPACISVLGSGVVTAEKPALAVRVCDMLGRPLPLSASDAVIAQSATRLADDVVVLSKQKLVATKDPTLYELELKHEPGRYRIALTAGSHSASLSATVLGTVSIQWLEIGVTDTDHASPSKLQKLQHPNKLSSLLDADSQQRLVVKFSLGGRIVHQAFVRLECQQSAREVIFVAEVDSNGIYKFDMDIGSKASELGIKSGKYNVELIIGDAIISNPFRWTLAEAELRITGPAAAQATSSPAAPIRGMRPEIKHMFREPERRPPPVISTLFTGLVIAPLVILFGIWIKLGINVSNFSFSLSGLLFHGGLAAIFGLFFVFWLKLDMFTTSRWLLLFGLITFLAGHRLLSSIASQRKH